MCFMVWIEYIHLFSIDFGLNINVFYTYLYLYWTVLILNNVCLFSDRGMFAGGLRETQQKEIPIHGVTFMAMTKILDYIYTSEIELDLECVQEVLIAATLVQVNSLKNLLLNHIFNFFFTLPVSLCVLKLEVVTGFCCDFLFSWLDESNILEVYNLADLYGLQQLSARVHSYMLRNIQTLSRTDVYRQLPQDVVFSALSSDELQVNSENEAYEAALHFHYSPLQVETDQVYLQVSPKVCLAFCTHLSFPSDTHKA